MRNVKILGLILLAILAAQSTLSEITKTNFKRSKILLIEGVPAIISSSLTEGSCIWYKNGQKLDWETNNFIRIDYPLNGDAGEYTVKSVRNTSIINASFKNSVSIFLNDQETDHDRLEVESFSIVKLTPFIDGLPVHYTLDGSEPNEKSEFYTSPIQITNSVIIRAKIIIPETESTSIKIVDDKGL